MGVPLRSGGSVIGDLHVGSLTPRDFTSDELELRQLAADRAAAALASLMAQGDRVAVQALRRSLLPSALPAIARVEMAVR